MKTFEEMESEFYQSVREQLLAMLKMCTGGNLRKFLLIYADGRTDLSVADAVATMDREKLAWAMEQVARTIEKNSRKDSGG